MKKLLFIISALTLCACTPITQPEAKREVQEEKEESKVYEEYAAFISKELESRDWCYTYKEVEPKKNEAHIIDFYSFDYVDSHSQWFCVKEDGEIDCDMLWIKYLN